MVEIWFMLFVLLLFIELITINLVTIWFVLGALLAIITTFITDNITIQIIVFIVSSVISLIITKPFINKIRKRKITPTNLDRVIGKSGLVTKEITKDTYGEIKVEGNIWTAASKEKIEKGSKAKVLKIEGVKLIVEKIKEEIE